MNKESIYVLLLTILGSLFVCGLVMLIVTMTVNSKDYKYYKTTYFAILNCTYIMTRNSYNQQTYHRTDETNPYSNDEIIFFLNRHGEVDSIKLLTRPSDNHYIHSKGGSDLYAKYWFKKILKVRDKYNHELWVSTQPEPIQNGSVYVGHYDDKKNLSFKFFKGC